MTGHSFSPASEQTVEARSPTPAERPASPSVTRIARSRPITLLIVGAGVLIAAIAFGTAAMIFDLRDRLVTDNERELQNIALVIAAQADRIFEAADRVETNLIEHFAELGVATSDDFERKMSGYSAHLLLKDKIVGLPHVGTFTLVNAQGRVFNFSRSWPIPAIDVTDRDFFEVLRRNGGPTAYLSKPIQNRATGTWVVQLARRISGPNGEFIGLVTAAIELNSIEQFFATIALGPDSSIGLFHRSGEVLARHPHIELLIGRVIPNSVVANLAQGAEQGVARRISPVDHGAERIVAVHRVAHYPLMVGATRDLGAVLADWRNEAALLIGAAGVVVLAIAALITLLVRQLSRNERRLLEHLVEQKLHLDSAINNMSQGLLMFDSSKRIVIVNQQYLEMYGLSAEMARPGCTLRELLSLRKENGSFAGDVDAYCVDLEARLAEGKTTSQILETPQGRAVQVLSHPMPGGWVVTHEDITERRRVEQERDRNREFLDLILENVPAPIFVKDAADRRYVLVNRAGEEFWGISRAAMIGKTSHEVFARKEADLITARDDQLLQSDQPSADERQIQTPNNGVRNIVSRRLTICGDDGQPRYLIGLINDITEWKQAEDKIRRTQAFLDTIIENVPATIIVKDARDFRHVMVNRAGEKLLGIPRDQIVGKKDGDIYGKEQADAITGRDIEICNSGEASHPGRPSPPDARQRRAHHHVQPGCASGRRREAAISLGRHRGHDRARPGGCTHRLHGASRPADRARQPLAVHGEDRGGGRPPAPARRGLYGLHARPRPLQGRQRFARPPGGRRAAQGDGAAPASRRCARPTCWRASAATNSPSCRAASRISARPPSCWPCGSSSWSPSRSSSTAAR